MNLRLLWCAIRGHQPKGANQPGFTPNIMVAMGTADVPYEIVSFDEDGFTLYPDTPSDAPNVPPVLVHADRCGFCNGITGVRVDHQDGRQAGIG